MKQTKGDFFVFSYSFLLVAETIKKITRVLNDRKHTTDAFCMLNQLKIHWVLNLIKRAARD